MRFLTIVFAFVAGALVTLQIGSDARLKEAVGGTLPAVIASSVLGIVLLGGAMLLMPTLWPPVAQLRAAPVSAWLGGVFGAVYAIATVFLVRHMGATTLIALVVAGQLICSVIVDHFGVLEFEPRPATLWRAAGCGLTLGGILSDLELLAAPQRTEASTKAPTMAPYARCATTVRIGVVRP